MIDSAQMYIAKLKAEELKYTTRDLPDGSIVVSVMFNMVFTHAIFQSNDNGKHVAFRTQLESVPAEKVNDMLVVCNSLNMRYRWLKFYLDKDNDIMVEDDAIVSPETAGEECFELLIRTAGIIKEVKPFIMKAIYA